MDNKTKRIITEEWLKAFPTLNAYAQNKLYKIIGPFIVGIELINLPRSEDYRPHFTIYSLWKSNIKSCLEYPVLMFEFYDKKQMQLNLPYFDVNGKYKEGINIVSNNIHISLHDDITLNRFYSLVNEILQNDNTNKSHSGKIASLLELKFYAALYVGSQNEMQNIMDQIQQASRDWDIKIFETWYGKFNLWLETLKGAISKRDMFLKQIELNKQDKKLLKLQSSKLIQ
jgi:hypothetical protein